MKKKNIILELVNILEIANRKRNIILIITVMLSVTSIFSLMSLVKGRIQADGIRIIRENGTTASVILENLSKEQYYTLSELNYVDDIGIVKEFGIWYRDNKKIAVCSIVGEKDFRKMYMPAYEHLVGNYPENANEVMLSVRILNKLGIKNPEIGMDIPINIVPYNWIKSGAENIEMNFRLSGYYTDYISDSEKLFTAYFATDFLNVQEKLFVRTHALIDSDKVWMSGSQIEKQFYQDVTLEIDQKFRIINKGVLQTMENMAGGSAIAVVGISLIFLSMSLFIFNIFSISINRDRKQYGLLKVIGTTPKQIQIIFTLQGMKIAVVGSIAGAVLGSIVVSFILPKLIEKMYLAGIGSADPVELHSWKLLFLSIFLTGLGIVTAFSRSMRKVTRLSPIACLNNEETITAPKKIQGSPKGLAIMGIAWRNFTRDRRKMIVSICSLFLGIEVALLSVVISSGLDRTHQIKRNPDFEVGVVKEAVENYLYQNEGEKLEDVQGHELVSSKMIADIRSIAGISDRNMMKCIGSYGTFNHRSEAMTPRLYSHQNDIDMIADLTVQVVSDEWIDILEQYVKKNELSTDMDTFKHQNGFILLHSHELSEEQSEEADKAIGKRLSGVLFEDGGNFFEMMCSGYLDTTEEGFPMLNMPWGGKNLNYIIISKHTMESIRVSPVTYNVTFNVKETDEPEIKNILKEFLTEANQNSENHNTYYLVANSDILAKEQSYILAVRILMGTFSGILIIFAIVSYCNTIITEMIARRMEFAILRSIGMTKKQITKMLIYEGNFYCCCTLGVLLSLGNIILIIIGKMVHKQISYFVFQYPALPFLLFAATLFLICILVPLIAFYRNNWKSIVEELRNVERYG